MIAGIAHQTHHFDHPVWGHAKLFLHTFYVKPFVFHGIEHADIRTDQLHHILIPTDYDYLQTFLRTFFSQGSHNIVGFITGNPDAVNIKGMYQRFKIGELFCQVLRRRFPVGFIISVHLVTKSLFLTVESNRQVIRLFVFYHFLQHIDEPVQSIGGKSF